MSTERVVEKGRHPQVMDLEERFARERTNNRLLLLQGRLPKLNFTNMQCDRIRKSVLAAHNEI